MVDVTMRKAFANELSIEEVERILIDYVLSRRVIGDGYELTEAQCSWYGPGAYCGEMNEPEGVTVIITLTAISG